MLTRKKIAELESVLAKQNIKIIKNRYVFLGNEVDIEATLIIPNKEPMETTYNKLLTQNSRIRDVWSYYNEE